MKKLIINPEHGMAGDMFVASLFHLGAPRKTLLDAMIYAAETIGSARIDALDMERNSLRGMILDIAVDGTEPNVDASDLYARLDDALIHLEVRDAYYDFALRAFDILSHAEFEAHNSHHSHVSHDQEMHTVHLHEAKDIVIDLVGAALGMQELNIDVENVTCVTPVYVGGGKIRFSHGEADVPAPATASIIESYDIPVKAGPVDKELFTPTGASILASLNPHYESRTTFTPSAGARIGIGFGSLDLSKSHNITNALVVYLA